MSVGLVCLSKGYRILSLLRHRYVRTLVFLLPSDGMSDEYGFRLPSGRCLACLYNSLYCTVCSLPWQQQQNQPWEWRGRGKCYWWFMLHNATIKGCPPTVVYLPPPTWSLKYSPPHRLSPMGGTGPPPTHTPIFGYGKPCHICWFCSVMRVMPERLYGWKLPYMLVLFCYVGNAWKIVWLAITIYVGSVLLCG